MDGVSVELLDVTPTSATIGILDTSDKEVLYGEDYSLQVFKDNDWEAVPYVIENWWFHSIGYSPQKNIRTEWEADWEWLYGKLEPGQYRMVKSFMDFRGTGDYTEYHYFIEFEISEE